MSSEVGSGHVSIFPVMTGFKSAVTKGTRDAGAAGAKSFDGGFKGTGLKTGRQLGRDLKSSLSSSAGDLGAEASKRFTKEIASASSALARVRIKQQDDAGRVRVAETRLAEAIAKSGEKSSQAVAAQERLSSARRTLTTTTNGVAAASDRLKNAQKALADASKAGAGPTLADRLKSGLAGAGQAASSAITALRNAGSRAGEAFGAALKGTATAGVTALVAAGSIALGKGFTRLGAIDTARAKLTGLGNDADSVKSIMDDALASVRGTSFGLGEAATVAAGAVAAGIKPGAQLQGTLKGIANVAAAANAPLEETGAIFNKVASTGRAYTENLNQLADRGIPIYQALATQLGVTTDEVRSMASEGKIDFQTFSDAAAAAAGTVAAEMGKTVPGAAKNFFAAMGRIGANALGGIYTKIAPLILAATSALGPIEERAKQFGDLLLRVLGPALDWITNLLTKIGEGASLADAGLGALSGILGPLAGVFAALGAGGLAGLLTKIPILGGMLGGLAGPLAALGGPLGIVAAGFAGFALSGADAGALVSSIVGIVDQVVAAMPLLVAKIATFVPQLVTSILAQVPALLNAAHGIVTTLADGIVQAIPVLVVGAVSLISGLVSAITASLPTIITGAINLVTALLQGIIQALPLLIQGAILLVTSLLKGIVTLLPVIIQGGVQLLMSLVQGLIQALPVIIQAALSLVMALLQAIITNLPLIIQAGWQLLLSLVTGLLDMLPELITAAITLILQLVVGIIKMLPELVKAGITLIVSLIKGLVEAIPQIIAALPEIVKAIWEGLAGVDWLGLGAEIIQGIIDGFFSMVGSVGDAIGDVLGGILDFFPHSPAKKGPLSATGWRQLRTSGAATMDQFTAGAEDGAGGFGDALAGVAQAASNRAQIALSAVSVGTGTAQPGAGGTPPGAGVSVVAHFEHVPFDEAVTAVGQQVASAARRARA